MLMGMFYTSVIDMLSGNDNYNDVYIHIGVGFCVARFDGMGSARASSSGTSNRTDSRAFLFKNLKSNLREELELCIT